MLTRDELLDNLMLYWLPRTGASSARLYWESIRQVDELITGPVHDIVEVPTGCSIFPKEMPRPSRRWAERRFTDIRWWNELDRGGHFAAFEQPALFVDEVRSAFRAMRCQPGFPLCCIGEGGNLHAVSVLERPAFHGPTLCLGPSRQRRSGVRGDEAVADQR